MYHLIVEDVASNSAKNTFEKLPNTIMTVAECSKKNNNFHGFHSKFTRIPDLNFYKSTPIRRVTKKNIFTAVLQKQNVSQLTLCLYFSTKIP